MKSIKIHIENPNIRQRFIVKTANFLLWLNFKLYFNNDFKKFKEEVKDIVIKARRGIMDCATKK